VHSSPGLAHVEVAASALPRGQLPLPGGFLAVNAKQAPPSMPIKMVTFDGTNASPSPPMHHPAVARSQQPPPASQPSPQMQMQLPPQQPAYLPQQQMTPGTTDGAPPSPPTSHSRTPSDHRGARFDPVRGWVST
jgi:hypothetical protein